MGSVNKVILVGHLGRNAELRYTTTGGTAVATLSLATSETWNDKAGQRQERTEWHRLVWWGKAPEAVAEYLTKGRQVYVEGKLQTREWKDKDDQKRFTTEIRVDQLVLIGGRDATSAPTHVRDEDVGHGEPVRIGPGIDPDDLIPF